ncbi:unnamed protein product [Merluccius merluccius]
MRSASRRLSQSLFDAYETDWAGDEELGAIVEGEDLLWNDYEVKLSDQALRTMESYMGQFPDVRAEEELSAAKYVYEAINTELKDDLPAFHESRIGCYVSVFSAVSSLRDIFHKEMSTLNTELQNVMKDLTLQHPGQVFTLKGVQRYGSLKRRSLMSPKSWKSSFSDFHQGYSPKIGAQRFSFRSPDKPRHGTLTRESSGGVSDGDGARPRPAEVLSSEFRDEETESLRSDADSCVADAQQQPGSGGLDVATGGAAQEPKAEDDQTGGGEEEKSVDADCEAEADPASQSQQEDKGQGDTPALSESSSELNRSFDSESLDMQLSSVANGTLYIEEKEDTQSNGVAVAALGSKEVSQKFLAWSRSEKHTLTRPGPADRRETPQLPLSSWPQVSPGPGTCRAAGALITTATPVQTESTVIGVVVALLLVTVAVVAFLLYRYLCHNKGAYRTTGEPAPGEDFAEDGKSNQATTDKKEYFI